MGGAQLGERNREKPLEVKRRVVGGGVDDPDPQERDTVRLSQRGESLLVVARRRDHRPRGRLREQRDELVDVVALAQAVQPYARAGTPTQA